MLKKDLGVYVDRNLNFKKHISQQKISKAKRIMLFLIKHTFKNPDNNIFKLLFKSIVHPHLQYASCIWNPISKEDRIYLERVQRQRTKILPELSTLTYTERLRQSEQILFSFSTMSIRIYFSTKKLTTNSVAILNTCSPP